MKKFILFILFIFVLISIIIAVFIAFSPVNDTQTTPKILPTPTSVIIKNKDFYQPKGGGLETEEYKSDERTFIQNTPLLQKLPETSDYFGIEYIDEQYVIIHSKTTNKQRDYDEAKKWFVENNIDTSKITLEYK